MTKKQADKTAAADLGLQLTLDNVPVDGALGLLAYGDIGLVAWRRKREEVEGPDWRRKLAEEIRADEEALKADAKGNKPDAQG